jgi:hypothetical protein
MRPPGDDAFNTVATLVHKRRRIDEEHIQMWRADVCAADLEVAVGHSTGAEVSSGPSRYRPQKRGGSNAIDLSGLTCRKLVLSRFSCLVEVVMQRIVLTLFFSASLFCGWTLGQTTSPGATGTIKDILEREAEASSKAEKADEALYQTTLKNIKPDIGEFIKSYLSIQVDSARLSRFLDYESQSLRPLVRTFESAGGIKPPDKECQLVFGNAAAVSQVSTFKIEEVALQGDPKEWIQRLDRLQCEMCMRIKKLDLNEAALRGIERRRAFFLGVMNAKEFELATTGRK